MIFPSLRLSAPSIKTISPRRLFSSSSTIFAIRNMKPIQFYTAGTPNGQKVSIMLEEIKALNPSFEYETHAIDIMKNTQKEDWFLKMNPNGRIPTILDPNNTATDQNGFAVMESMSIMLYLEKKYDNEHAFSWSDSEPKKENFRNLVLQWMSWQMAGQGPMQGQANHFRMQAVGDSKNVVPYGIKRYHDETVRLYQVLEMGLQGKHYLVGDGKGKYSLADMICFPWALWYRFSGIKNEEVGPNVKAWIERIKQRPAVQKGLRIPTESQLLKNLDDPNWMPPMPEL
ncbi:related to glutathione s-transferase [Melanopsichium pennsylvanicum]|uniref:Related to glutathione s-transferase n=1 Tax=Melanopsichium pennsylvanicum TaxID=63383 RepID=A0AAJ4XLU4_9BASI|nr:related to glutathione s-transferase [Melanopsichium pennsylvanicum]